MKKILRPENQKVFVMKENLVWAHHGQLWDTYSERDNAIFGETDDLERYVMLSQYMQAEGLRYAIESQLRKYPETSGISIWQLNEPWPNISCTNLVDYYGVPKLAYYFVKNAYKTFHVSLKYNKLIYSPGDIFSAELYIHNENGVKNPSASVKVIDSNHNCVFTKNIDNITESSLPQQVLSFEIPADNLGKIFYVECNLFGTDTADKNVYMFFVASDEYADSDAVISFTKEFYKQIDKENND